MKHPPSTKQLRDFGLVIGIGLPLIFGWFVPSLLGHQFRAWTLWLGIPALILGFFAPRFLRLPYRGWMALGEALGWVNSHIILGLIFVLVLQPIAMIMRLVGHDPLRRKIHHATQSYREQRKSLSVDFTRIF